MRIVPSLNRINKKKKKLSSEKFEITKFCVLSQRSKINILSTEKQDDIIYMQQTVTSCALRQWGSDKQAQQVSNR